MLQTGGGGEVGVKRGAVVPSYFVAERRVLRFLDCFHPSSALFREQTRAAWPGLPKRARDACGIGVPVPPSLPAPSCAPAAAGDRLLEPCTRCRGAAAAPAALSLPCPPPGEEVQHRASLSFTELAPTERAHTRAFWQIASAGGPAASDFAGLWAAGISGRFLAY